VNAPKISERFWLEKGVWFKLGILAIFIHKQQIRKMSFEAIGYIIT
jgi:uncharacterized protein YwqG